VQITLSCTRSELLVQLLVLRVDTMKSHLKFIKKMLKLCHFFKKQIVKRKDLFCTFLLC